MRVEIEREDGDRLGGEEFSPRSGPHDECLSWFRAACRHPRDELSPATPNPQCSLNSALRIPRSALYFFDDLLGRTVNPLQTIGAHKTSPQLRGLDYRTHLGERRE